MENEVNRIDVIVWELRKFVVELEDLGLDHEEMGVFNGMSVIINDAVKVFDTHNRTRACRN